MKLQIERDTLEAMVAAFPELRPLTEQLKFGNRAELPFHHLDTAQLRFLHERYAAAGPAMAGRAAQLATLERALAEGGERFAEGELERLVPALAEFLLRDGIRGWLFRADPAGKPPPYLVARIDFTPPGEEEAGRILLDLKANAMARIVTATVMIGERDIPGRSVAEILAAKGFLKETAALIEAYDRSAERFFAWRADYSRQFSARGTGIFAEDPNAARRNTDWARKSVVVLSSGGEWARLVNDEEILDTLAERFPEASGRDIKGLAKVTAKYCRHKAAAPTLEVFERCSIFRGMEYDGEEAPA
jgi:hypothetical protein